MWWRVNGNRPHSRRTETSPPVADNPRPADSLLASSSTEHRDTEKISSLLIDVCQDEEPVQRIRQHCCGLVISSYADSAEAWRRTGDAAMMVVGPDRCRSGPRGQNARSPRAEGGVPITAAHLGEQARPVERGAPVGPSEPAQQTPAGQPERYTAHHQRNCWRHRHERKPEKVACARLICSESSAVGNIFDLVTAEKLIRCDHRPRISASGDSGKDFLGALLDGRRLRNGGLSGEHGESRAAAPWADPARYV